MTAKRSVGIALLTALIAMTGGKSETRGSQPKKGRQKEATTVAAKKAASDIGQYGFRVDPMKWVASDKTLDGAIARTFVFATPREGDKKLIDAEIAKILAEQKADGSFGKGETTGKRVCRLIALGVDHDRSEIKRAAEAMLAGKKLDHDSVQALCLLGHDKKKLVQSTLKAFAADARNWKHPRWSCPWNQSIHWRTVYPARKHHGLDKALAKSLRLAEKELHAFGASRFNDPWGYIESVSMIDTPEARAVLKKLVPMILRNQKPDGGWEGRGVHVLRAMKRHDLLDTLRTRPALPADWKITKTIPAPTGERNGIFWDGDAMWVYRKDPAEAIRISIRDGKELSRVKLPAGKIQSLCWWNGSLVVAQQEPKKRLLIVAPDTGKVRREIAVGSVHWVNEIGEMGGNIYLFDAWDPCLWTIEPVSGTVKRGEPFATRSPTMMSAAGNTFWFYDVWSDSILRTSLRGNVVAAGENPFKSKCGGVAWDGKNLWALDNENNRICRIEKAEPGKERTGRRIE